MKQLPLFNRILNLGISYAKDDHDRRLIRLNNFASLAAIFFLIPTIYFLSDIGNEKVFAILIAAMLAALMLSFYLNISGNNQIGALIIQLTSIGTTSIVVFYSNVQTGVPLTNLVVAIGSNYLFKKKSWKVIMSLLSLIVFFILGYYQYKYLPFDDKEYFISSSLLVFLFMITQYSISQNDKYQKKIETQNHEIAKQRDHLEELNKTKNRFFSIISHDLRGPMNILIGFNTIIKDHISKNYNTKSDQRLDEINQYLTNSANQVLNLLDSLLKWAMKEEGVIPNNPEKLDLNECIIENIQMLELQADSKNITISFQAQNQEFVFADKNSLMTIIRNLSSNALKFTPENGVISFNVDSIEGLRVLSVTDTGVGIPKNKLATLFKIDEKKSTIGTQGEKGTGLGLNLVYDFVKMNKGKIEVESEIAKGTTFNVFLPKV